MKSEDKAVMEKQVVSNESGFKKGRRYITEGRLVRICVDPNAEHKADRYYCAIVAGGSSEDNSVNLWVFPNINEGREVATRHDAPYPETNVQYGHGKREWLWPEEVDLQKSPVVPPILSGTEVVTEAQ